MYPRLLKLGTLTIIGLLFISGSPLIGQTTSSMYGVVTDAQGAILPGVTVTVESPLLRREVTVVTDEIGRFLALALQPGEYSVTASLPGFTTEVISGIALSLNSRLEVPITLQVSGGEERIEVRSVVGIVRENQSDLQELINTDTIDNIPLNGRQFLDLARLAPATAPRPSSSDQGADLTVFGERSVTNSFLVDGFDNNDMYTRGFSEFFIQDAVQEFKLMLGGYEAEFGRAQGAVANVITRSGTDEFHGRAFGYFRNDQFDSSNIRGQEPPKLARRELGATFGGPIAAGKTYFFEAFELYREERGVNFDQSILPKIITDGYYTPAFGGSEPFDRPPLDTRFTNFFRIDHNFNERNQLFFTVNINRGAENNYLPDPNRGFASPPPGTIVLPSIGSDLTLNTGSFNIRETSFLSDNLFMESSVRLARNEFTENVDKPNSAEQLFPITTGFAVWMSNASPIASIRRPQEQFQWTENLSYVTNSGATGRHNFKFGWDWNRIDLAHEFISSSQIIIGNPVIDTNYSSLGYDVTMFRILRPILENDTVANSTTNNWALYAQDKWDLTPGVTLNLGLRWDWVSMFGSDKNALSPRIGLAWDVNNAGKTVLRASYGRFYDSSVMEVAARTNSMGGVQYGGGTVFPLSRGGSFMNNPSQGAFDYLTSSGTRWLSNPKFYAHVFPVGADATVGAQSMTALGKPHIMYELLGIAVPDPANPPKLLHGNIATLTGGAHTPESALAVINNYFPNPDAKADPQFLWLEETGASSLNTGRPLAYNFNPLTPDYIFEIDRPFQLPYTDSLNIGIEQAIGDNLSIDGQVFIRRSKDLLTRRISNLLAVPIAGVCHGNTTDGGFCRQRLENMGYLNSNVFALSLNKRFSKRHSYMISYTFTDATDNFSTLRIPPSSGEISFLFSNQPELDVGRSLNSPRHVFVANSQVALPWNVNLSGVFLSMSGRPFNAAGLPLDSDGDGFFDNRLLGTGKGQYMTDKTVNVDLRLSKVFDVNERASVTGLFEIFNVFNRANPFKVNTTCSDSDGDGSPDPKGCSGGSFNSNVEPLAGREIQLGLRLDF